MEFTIKETGEKRDIVYYANGIEDETNQIVGNLGMYIHEIVVHDEETGACIISEEDFDWLKEYFSQQEIIDELQEEAESLGATWEEIADIIHTGTDSEWIYNGFVAAGLRELIAKQKKTGRVLITQQ